RGQKETRQRRRGETENHLVAMQRRRRPAVRRVKPALEYADPGHEPQRGMQPGQQKERPEAALEERQRRRGGFGVRNRRHELKPFRLQYYARAAPPRATAVRVTLRRAASFCASRRK